MDRVRYQWIQQQLRATRPTPSKKWFKEIQGILFRKGTNGQWLKVIQNFEKDIILNGLHSDPLSGHFGFENTLRKIKQRYYWPQMTQDVENFVKSCDICQWRHGKGKQTPIYPIPVGQPFEKLGIDLIGPLPITATQKQYIIVAIDYLTKWIEARPIPAKEAQQITKFLLEEIITRHGVPKELISDNGLEFANQQMIDFCTKYGIKQLFASPYHPQTNGLVERINKTLADTITKISRETNKNWDQYIAEALFVIQTTYQSTTKQTPFYLTYGREARIPIDSQYLDLETSQDTWEKAEQV
jgi:hypothetical protein